MSDLIRIITASDPELRNQSLDSFCTKLSADELLKRCDALDDFRRHHENLYERVRALFFLYAIHRFHLPEKLRASHVSRRTFSLIPFQGYEHLLQRRFEEAIDSFLEVQKREGASEAICSAMANAYHKLGFQTLANQVRRSVRSVRGNQWMFRMGHPADHPLRIRAELLKKNPDGAYPILRERTPVRMDLTHCGWSDIFFLGMDFPEGAKVLNVSIDLGVHGRDAAPRPPVEAYLRVIDEPLLRLVSVDLGAKADITNLADVFDFAKDYLGLLKAAIIAAGVVPPGIEGSGQNLSDLLARVVGTGRGLEIISNVNNIPKGSRLAVSTNLLAALVSVCMRATRQAASLTGGLEESERQIVLARALLGEWLGGSGGGWQDSGGIWTGMKLIEGALAQERDPEFGISRGRLMPTHRILGERDASSETRRKLQESLVLVHGGMAQNVGPILEMVTEKYLLRVEAEWNARTGMLRILDEILGALRDGDVRAIGAATTKNFFQPIQTIVPWANNYFTETLIQRVRNEFGDAFWGFWMLGGMSGGGMGFIFAPEKKSLAQGRLQEIMAELKCELEQALPFAMPPVVYDFSINERGTIADLIKDDSALPAQYGPLFVPASQRLEVSSVTKQESLASLLEQYGFDRAQHEQIRADLKAGRIGLAENRLPANAVIENIRADEVADFSSVCADGASAESRLFSLRSRGLVALKNREVAVVTLAAGAGSRWTQGAGVVKALHPFCRLGDNYRTFIEVHLAKSRRIARNVGAAPSHVFTTSYLTHEPLAEFMERKKNFDYEGAVYLSLGKAIGLRLIPTERDLRFIWEEMPEQVLDEQQQKVRESLRNALIHWAKASGEASDYTDNLPLQCLHPVGHWYEIPNLFRNGVLTSLLRNQPQLKYLMLHNIDTLGADLDPALLGLHIESGACLTFEVIPRCIEDRGGGLAWVNGHMRLVEGLAMPQEDVEFTLSYYNSNTSWIDLDQLLKTFGLGRDEFLRDRFNKESVEDAIRKLAAKMPTYVTLKDVKRRWGAGQEDVFPVVQWEKLWVDMTALTEVASRFVVVPRLRGQQLKDQAQLDGWLRDGSSAYVEGLCEWR